MLHRVIERKWSAEEKFDVVIIYDRNEKNLKFEYKAVTGRKVVWSGDTQMNFLITEYNDPNILYKMISFTISELVNNPKVFNDIDLPSKFSIYTRRIFKNYVLEEV